MPMLRVCMNVLISRTQTFENIVKLKQVVKQHQLEEACLDTFMHFSLIS